MFNKSAQTDQIGDLSCTSCVVQTPAALPLFTFHQRPNKTSAGRHIVFGFVPLFFLSDSSFYLEIIFKNHIKGLHLIPFN